MISLPSYPFLTTPIITSCSKESIYSQIRDMAGTPTTIAWTTANQARYVPFWIPEPITVVKLMVYTSTTSGGNNDMGIYDAAGSEIRGIAAAAHPGTVGWHEFDITDTPLRAGQLVYVGILNTTTTATFSGFANKEIGRAAGVFSQAVGAATLPSPTATFAALDQALIPIVAMSTRVTT